jgi:hypothetical protein
MEDKIFSVTDHDFESVALDVFRFQYQFNKIYRSWIDTLGIDPASVGNIQQIPFLPISFFKTHKVLTTEFEPAIVFESSGTTGSENSRRSCSSRRRRGSSPSNANAARMPTIRPATIPTARLSAVRGADREVGGKAVVATRMSGSGPARSVCSSLS